MIMNITIWLILTVLLVILTWGDDIRKLIKRKNKGL